MNQKSFGDECKCGHFESDHKPVKKNPSIESVTKNYSFIMPPAGFPSEFGRDKCKICDCMEFVAKKKKRWWKK